jgi:hypothetical protein
VSEIKPTILTGLKFFGSFFTNACPPSIFVFLLRCLVFAIKIRV